jgi:hypothetical protein
MHKLLRIIFGILKNKSSFNPATDQANKHQAIKKQEKKEQEEKGGKKEKKRELFRFKNPSLDAPISRQAAGKIKKQMTSQT